MSERNPFELYFRQALVTMIKTACDVPKDGNDRAQFFNGLFVALAGNIARLIAQEDSTKRTLMLAVIGRTIDEEVAREAAERAIKTAAAIDKKE